jgi:dienelactone hydrolase
MKPLLALGTVVWVALATAGTRPVVAAAQGGTADVEATATQVVEHLAAGDADAAVSLFDPSLQTRLPAPRLAATWNAVVQQAGAFKRRTAVRIESDAATTTAIVTCEMERASIDIRVVLNATGRVGGLFIAPAVPVVAYSVPPYANPARYREDEVTVGAPGWPLPGTLTRPVDSALVPAVVLVHGSGPGDRDESVGANKPFKDLALGLASSGVAVLRYEKRTKQFPARMRGINGFTVNDETIDDAVAAVDFLRHQPGIDPDRIVVVGHSLGGTLIPRIARADARIAGLVVLAGAVRSIDDAMRAQLQYIAEADGTITPAEQQQMDAVARSLAPVAALTEADAANPTPIAGAPASYWLDLRGYNPPEAARAVTQPMLILQGERDYQVTMAEFDTWKATLASRPATTFKSYPSLNHLFIAGTGKSLPAEYAVPGHVSADVVADIASWVRAVPHAAAGAAAR